jgi:dTDP-4-amino-4,6-dideoxygalactose transaminase
VHIGGLISRRVPAIRDLCRTKGLFLFEDAAHAHGSSLDGQFAGSFGDAASFSFYPTKIITSGEGGIIVSNDVKIRDEAFIYRDQGKAGFLENKHTRMGYNWRLSEIHALLGIAQLQNLKAFIDRRNAIARIYDQRLREVKKLKPLAMPTGVLCNYYKYIALLDSAINRVALKKQLRENHNVSLSGEVYEDPLHLQPVFKDYAQGSFPKAERFCKGHVCLPIYSDMTEEEADYVVWSLTKTLI